MNSLKENKKIFSSYAESDVIFLLKDVSDFKLEGTIAHREEQIQSGQHYSETLPIEYQPPQNYMKLFWETLSVYKSKVAFCVGVVAEQIYKLKGENTVLVSLARAGTPVGILIKRYLSETYSVDLPHYSVSIIRDRGLDENAIQYILDRHPGKNIQFIDGWTGKGAISKELTEACHSINKKNGKLLDDTLAVLADPGYCTSIFGTREDFLIPSACLNSTVSGLISRTVLNSEIIGQDDFHGAKYYRDLINVDVSNEFLNVITKEFSHIITEAQNEANHLLNCHWKATFKGMEEVLKIQERFNIENTHYIKPGVGETTRVLLRRVPWKILIQDLNSPFVKHILLLAHERKVEVEQYPNMSYTCCGLIKKVGKDS